MLAKPPVAMTVHFSPSSSSSRSIMPSIPLAVEYIIPLFMQSTVFLPMTRFGLSKLILGSCDVLLKRASAETAIPVVITPPR